VTQLSLTKRPQERPRYADVLYALNECVIACEQLVEHGFSPPHSLLTINRATVLRWVEWSPMLERNPDLADTWLSLCANTCKSWADAYRSYADEVSQRCVAACELCIEVCNQALNKELNAHPQQQFQLEL
jgi:hypothetical protein